MTSGRSWGSGSTLWPPTPLRVRTVVRDEPRYRLQERTVGPERFAHAARCAGVHLHFEAEPGTIDQRVGVSYGASEEADDRAPPKARRSLKRGSGRKGGRGTRRADEPPRRGVRAGAPAMADLAGRGRRPPVAEASRERGESVLRLRGKAVVVFVLTIALLAALASLAMGVFATPG